MTLPTIRLLGTLRSDEAAPEEAGPGEVRVSEAVIVASARTPIGKVGRGSLADVRSDDLGGFAVDQALAQVPALDPAEVTDLYWGCALTYHSQGYNIGRQVGLLSQLPDTVPATTMTRACASSLTALRAAVHAIRAGDGEAYVVGGSDSYSMVMDRGFGPEDHNPRFTDAARPDFAGHAYVDVFDTAEVVADRYGVSRQEMDELALLSHRRAVAAREGGFFAREISPYPKPDGTVVHDDDCPRPDTSLERLADLRPVLRNWAGPGASGGSGASGGRVTAGNTTVAGDGAAALVVTSADRAAELGLAPLARVISTAVSGLAPEVMGVGPIEATRRALDRAGLAVGDLDVVECHENFAAQVIPVCRELGIDVERQLNPFGGSLALGHPSGMTGVRLVVTLLNGLRQRDATLGAATTCAAGGQGMTVVVERLS
jgi:acetyl-CoA C-acetyltransferase